MSNNLLIDSLKRLLADSYVLYLKTQNYHWNVTGSNFKSLHDLFQIQYEDLAIAIDDIAERIRSLGEYAPGSFSEYNDLASIKEVVENKSSGDMLRDLSSDQTKIIDSLKSVLKAAQNVDDEVTIGLVTDRMSVHEKNKWMLESSL